MSAVLKKTADTNPIDLDFLSACSESRATDGDGVQTNFQADRNVCPTILSRKAPSAGKLRGTQQQWSLCFYRSGFAWDCAWPSLRPREPWQPDTGSRINPTGIAKS